MPWNIDGTRSASSTNTGRPGWHATRRRILDRDAHVCQSCGADATTVDHVLPVAFGGTNDDDNLQSLCAACHGRKTNTEAAAGRARTRAKALHPRPRRHPGLS